MTNATMVSSEGKGTRGLVCKQCTDILIKGGTFNNLINTEAEGLGAAFRFSETCCAAISDASFTNIQANKGPAVYV